MNQEESKKLLMYLKHNFQHSYKDLDEIGMKILIGSWSRFFSDIPYSVMFTVAEQHALENDFPPTVKQLREKALAIMNPIGIMTPETAWEKALKTVRRFGRYNKDKGMESLINYPSVARALRTVGWDRIGDCPDEKLGFLKNEFTGFFSEVNQEAKQEYLMPKEMLNKIQQIQHARLEHKDDDVS